MNSFELNTQFRPSTAVDSAVRRPTAVVSAPSRGAIVRTVVRSVDVQKLRPIGPPHAGVAFETKTLLAITLYCYLHDIYGSEAIEDALRRDAVFRQLCHQEFPGARL